MNFDPFQAENDTIERGESLLAEEQDIDFRKEYRSLLNSYGKLSKLAQRILKLSDRNEQGLKEANIRIQQQQTDLENVNKTLEEYAQILEDKVEERTQQLALTQEVTIESMAVLAEYRDPETGGHIRRTKRYVRALANRLKEHPHFCDYFGRETIDLLYRSSPLHDIGKIGVPDQILLKPGSLTYEEFEVMKLHTDYGHAAISAAEKKLGNNSFLRFAREITYTHHEKWDGSGYPQGLKGEDIPIPGRLMALADVYDALISKRVYKPPIPHSKAMAMIKEGRGTHFDPQMVDIFLELDEEIRQIGLEFAENQLEVHAMSK
ncbi:MAG: HD domain-containing protein [Deltaproteobacteria bacterium]|nr:HD domain-containing protein [Deltaproteobacteria bacterium]